MDWPMVALHEAAEIRGGSTPRRDRPEYWDGDIPWLTPSDLPPAGAGIADIHGTAHRVTEQGLASSSAVLLPPGTVHFSSRASIGKIGIAAVPMVTNQGFANLIPRPGVDSRYLAWCLSFHADQIARLARRTTIKEVPRRAMRLFRIPLPALSEQRLIVQVFDQADHVRSLRSEADTKARRILPALFVKMFGNPSANPMGWPSHTLGELSTLGPQIGLSTRSAPLSEGHPHCVRIAGIRETGRLSDEPVGIDIADWEPYRLVDGDLLLARSGPAAGKPYLHRREEGSYVFASHFVRFRLDESRLHPLVAFGFTQTSAYSDWVESKRRRARRLHINAREYASIRVPVPDRELQDKFVGIHGRLAAAADRSFNTARALEHLFSNLLSRAFSGTLTAPWREAHMQAPLREPKPQIELAR